MPLGHISFRAPSGSLFAQYFLYIPKTCSVKLFFELIKNTERRKYQRGATSQSQGWRARPTPWACPLPRGPPGGPSMTIFCYMDSFDEEKIIIHLPGRDSAATRRNQSRALTELFCRGNFPPGGGNHHHRHHQRSSHREGVNLHQHLHQHHLISKP